MTDAARIFDAAPANRTLGLELVERSSQGATMRMRSGVHLKQEAGVVHGGLLSALADSAAVYAFLPDLEDTRGLTSIEFKMNFLRPAAPEGADLVARSRVVKRGRRIGVCEVDVEQGDRLVARGTFTYMFLT